MRTTLRCLLSAVVLLWSAGARADDTSVLLLHHICNDTDQRSQSACSGFLVGLIAGLQYGTKAAREGKAICLPDDFAPDKMKLMLDKIVKEKPEFAALPALPALAFALQSVFPCRAPTPRPPKKK